MKRTVLLLGIACFVTGVLSLLLLEPAVRVLTDYHPPVSNLGHGSRGVPVTERVILVVLSGIANRQLNHPDDPWRFVQIRRRAGEGAYGTARAVQPSGDAPTWAALLSGAGPSHSGIVDARESTPLPIATLFDYATSAGLQSAVVAAPVAWQARADLATPARLVLARSGPAVGETAAAMLRTRVERFVVVLIDVGRAAAFRPAERFDRVDREVALILDALDPARDTLIVTGDHGILPDGSSGGGEAAVVNVPLVLWGRSISPGPVGTVDQRDIAATIAALLGLAYPPYGGRPLLDALAIPVSVRASELVRLLDTRVAAAQSITGEAKAEGAQALETARSELEQQQWERAISAVASGLAALDRPPAPPWYFSSAWVWGAGVPLLLLGLARLVGRLRDRLFHLRLPVAGLAGYLSIWCAIYFGLAGKTLSLSAIYGEWNSALLEIGLWGVLALAVLALGLGLVRANLGPWTAASATGWATALVLISLAGLVGLYMLLVGLPDTALPGLTGWTAMLIAMAQVAGAGLAAPLAMLLAAGVAEVIGRGR